MNNVMSCKIDWLKVAFCSVNARNLLPSLLADLCDSFSAEQQESTKGKHGYQLCYPVGHGTGKNFVRCGQAQVGGNTRSKLGDHVQIELSGSKADHYYNTTTFFSDLPESCSAAYVQRIDLAYDVTGDFQSISDLILSLPEMARVSTSYIESVENGVLCRTRYFGSRTSAFFIRLYEKGKQTGGASDWLRFEVEVKPTKTSLDFAVWCFSQLHSDVQTIIGCCNHVSAALEAVTGVSVPYTPRTEKELPPTVASFRHLIKQYSAVASGVNELYDVSDMLVLFEEVHRLKQAENKISDQEIDEHINQFLLDRIRT